MKRLVIIVSGRVQGVFYRASTKDQAGLLGVNGFVRNEANGDIYIEAEGDEAQLEKLLTWCHKGPPRSIVQKIITLEKELIGFKNFEVRR